MILTIGYHWSPIARRASITRLGLVPGRRPTCSSSAKDWHDGGLVPSDWRPDYVCLGADPDMAAAYSWRVHGEPGETWDLWQVYLLRSDDLRGRRDGGRELIEARVHNRIPKRRISFIATRLLVPGRGSRPA